MELNKYGFSTKRTRDLVKAIEKDLQENFPYAKSIKGEDVGVCVCMNSLETDYEGYFMVFVNGTEPTHVNPFVPVYKTAQINLGVMEEHASNKEFVLYPYLNKKRPVASGIMYQWYSFGQYKDEDRPGMLEDIASNVTKRLLDIVHDYFKYAEEERNSFYEKLL